jgi:hypothetical protein
VDEETVPVAGAAATAGLGLVERTPREARGTSVEVGYLTGVTLNLNRKSNRIWGKGGLGAERNIPEERATEKKWLEGSLIRL